MLVIDDDDAVTDYLALTLGDPRGALELARRERPDVILCDPQMPHMDGLAVRPALASSADTRGIPVRLLSASAAGPDTVSKQAPAAQIVARLLAPAS